MNRFFYIFVAQNFIYLDKKTTMKNTLTILLCLVFFAANTQNIFEEDFETFVDTELDLPDGSVEVIDVTVDRDIEIIVDFIITLTEEELEETDYESTEDLGSDLEEIEEEIEAQQKREEEETFFF